MATSKRQRDHRHQESKNNHHTASLGNTTLALQYAQEGFPVVPLYGIKDGHCTCGDEYCNRSGKHPRTKRGIVDATSDPTEIERLWANRPKAKIGIVMGGPSKLVALVTEGKGGRQNLRSITTRNGKLPRTGTIQDRDQRFRLYRVGANQPCSVELGDGVRILGDGELIVAPSLSSTGKRRFVKGRAFGEIDIARAPDWLFADLTSAESTNGQAGSKVDGNGESAEDEAKPIRFQPFANLFPMVTREHLEELAQDIKDHGLLDPIVLYEGQILDGRCRYLACQIASVEPEFQDYVGDDPLGFVVSRNLHRRHLTESQRAIVAARLAALKRGANQHSQGLPIGRAANILNVGARSVARARDVLRRGAPELVTAVEAGEIAVSAAADISGMPESEQRKMIASTPGGSTNADGQARIKKAGKAARYKTGKSKNQRGAGVPREIAPAAEVEKLKSELAAANERQRELEEELETARVAALESRAASSIEIPPDLEIPPFLDRRPLSAEDRAAFDSVMAAWTKSAAQDALLRASPVVQERFIATVRAEIASARSATN
jgi:hypothetical protein